MLELINVNNKEKHLNINYLLSEGSGVELSVTALNIAFCAAIIFEPKSAPTDDFHIPLDLTDIKEVRKFVLNRFTVLQHDNLVMNYNFFNIEDLRIKGADALVSEFFDDVIYTSLLCDNTFDDDMEEDYFSSLLGRMYLRLKNENEASIYFRYVNCYVYYNDNTYMYDMEHFNVILSSFDMTPLVGEPGTARNKLSLRGFLKEFESTFETA